MTDITSDTTIDYRIHRWTTTNATRWAVRPDNDENGYGYTGTIADEWSVPSTATRLAQARLERLQQKYEMDRLMGMMPSKFYVQTPKQPSWDQWISNHRAGLSQSESEHVPTDLGTITYEENA